MQNFLNVPFDVETMIFIGIFGVKKKEGRATSARRV